MAKDYLRANIPITKPILYIDMDGVVADYDSYIQQEEANGRNRFDIFKDKGVFENLAPIPGAVEAFTKLSEKFEIYFLSTPLWSNPHTWGEKRIWLEKTFGKSAKKKLILSHNKGLVKGDYLIDDRIANGVGDFEGEHIHFGTEDFPDWSSVLRYLLQDNVMWV